MFRKSFSQYMHYATVSRLNVLIVIMSWITTESKSKDSEVLFHAIAYLQRLIHWGNGLVG